MSTYKRRTTAEYSTELSTVNPYVGIIGEFKAISVKTPHICKKCGYGANGEWMPTPANLLWKKSGCPICSGRFVGPAPNYVNSIWASNYKELFKSYMTEDQMKLYTPFSAKKISMHCPDCGSVKIIAPQTISGMGSFGCSCSDGQSYPNKFIYALLNQLAINYITEYSPDWSENKRYDIYIPSINCIIENHGRQHYEEQTGVFDNLTDTQQNDEYKIQLAKKNGIEHYINLDCRYSTADWICASVLHSVLPKLLNFSDESIDWQECAKYATKNRIRVAAELWNSGLTVREIYEKMFIGKTTAYDYLNKARKLGWCSYTSKENNKRSKERGVFATRAAQKAKKVYCFELDQYFNSLSDAARFLNTYGSKITAGNIQQCCSGRYHSVSGYHFCYANKIDEYIFTKRKINGKQVFCKETGMVYDSITNAAESTNLSQETIRTCCEGRHWCRKTKSNFYYLYDCECHGVRVLGAISLGFITEDDAWAQLDNNN